MGEKAFLCTFLPLTISFSLPEVISKVVSLFLCFKAVVSWMLETEVNCNPLLSAYTFLFPALWQTKLLRSTKPHVVKQIREDNFFGSGCGYTTLCTSPKKRVAPGPEQASLHWHLTLYSTLFPSSTPPPPLVPFLCSLPGGSLLWVSQAVGVQAFAGKGPHAAGSFCQWKPCTHKTCYWQL